MKASRVEKAAIYAAAYVAVLMADHVPRRPVRSTRDDAAWDVPYWEAAERVEATRARRALAHNAACAAVKAWLEDNLEIPE